MQISFDARLTQALQSRHKTAKELAAACGVTVASISAYTRGLNLPSITVLIKICQTLDVSADYLLGLQTEPMPLNAQFLAGLTIPRTPYDDLSAESRKALDTYAQFLRSQESAAHEEEASS